MEYVLGIDVGTTGTKSVLFTGDGELSDIEYISYPITSPQEGWAEQKPQDGWQALTETAQAVVRRNGSGKKVRSLSLSTQGGCLVLLDGNFSPGEHRSRCSKPWRLLAGVPALPGCCSLHSTACCFTNPGWATSVSYAPYSPACIRSKEGSGS